MATNCPHCLARVAAASFDSGPSFADCPHCGLSLEAATAGRTQANADGQLGRTKHVVVRREAVVDGTPVPRLMARVAESVPDTGPPDLPGPGAPPSRLPGYAIEATLGFGGMGTVYLARQLSLDRPVALKVMSRRYAADPVFAARFTREAFAAARLNHPNVVQIFDVGEADGLRYFSMEFVPGRSLADHVKFDGKLDPETAVGYVLQAARGLKHAHDRGLIHRDVKPDNLMLDETGVVKVADLGLVKAVRPGPQDAGIDFGEFSPAVPPDESAETARASVTMTGARMALGTPAYMSPEQCRDAAAVDHRADIYSLGCTLYVLVTGRTPFDGSTAVEVMTKHAYEPITPPELLVNRVPKELSAVILRMMAKHAADRFADMGEVIRTLEQWLGIHPAVNFSPRDEQIDELEAQATAYNAAPTAVLKARVLGGAASALVLGSVLLSFFGQLGWAFGLAGFLLQAALAYFVVDGVATGGYLFRRVRKFAAAMSGWDWALVVAAAGLFALLLGMLGLFALWAGFSCLGVALACAVRLTFDRAVEAQRAAPIAASKRLLRRMRLGGLGENELRLFVAKYAGRDWEQFFEALFGYEAKIALRGILLRGGSAGVREKHAAWREPIINLVTRVERGRQEARERQPLLDAEQAGFLKSLGSTGRPVTESHFAGGDGGSAAIRHEAGQYPGVHTAMMLPNLAELVAARQAKLAADAPRDRAEAAANLFVGLHVRVVAAAVLLAAFVLWVEQNDLLARVRTPAGPPAATQPLTIDWLPEAATAWCDGVNAGWAGVLLLASLFFRGNRTGALALVGAAVCAIGHQHGVRTVEPIRDYHVALLLGSVLALVGFRIARR